MALEKALFEINSTTICLIPAILQPLQNTSFRILHELLITDPWSVPLLKTALIFLVGSVTLRVYSTVSKNQTVVALPLFFALLLSYNLLALFIDVQNFCI